MATGNFPKAKKSLGQHWLVDIQSLDSICQAARLNKDDIILEIGPGTGNLTRLLLDRVKQVIAVELDPDLVAVMNRIDSPKLEVLHQDILSLDFRSLPAGYKIVANIPYYLTGKLIRLISEVPNPPSLVVLLVQKEIAERMTALPGQLSILALTSQYFWTINKGDVITADKFDPPPKVDSQVISLEPKSNLLLASGQQAGLFRLIKLGFVSPRKTILNNLSSGYQLDKVGLQDQLRKLDIDPTRRPQSLSLNEWLLINNSLNTPKI